MGEQRTVPDRWTSLLDIGFDKNGEANYLASMQISDLSYEDMQRLRAIVPVAIYQLEEIWSKFGPPSKLMAAQQSVPVEAKR